MANDFSRVRLNPLLDYAGVELKQGGVLLDAEANELVGIVDRRLRALASDVLGRATVSSTTVDAFKIAVSGTSLTVGKGRLYVDGLLAENHGAFSADSAKRVFDDLMAEPQFADPIGYAAQPYLPNPPALPTAGRHLVYLDVWDREVTHLEQPDLVENAVGVETASRIQTVWQVRAVAEDAGAGTICSSPDSDVPGWEDIIAPSTGVLSTGTFEVAPVDDPCELPPTGGYRGPENQLYRVEIHDAGQPGAGATFKWSRENASVGSRVASIVSGSELELETLGRDDVLSIKTGDWVEIIDDQREFSQTSGEMRKVTVVEATRRIQFTPALPAAMLPATFPNGAFPDARNLRVKRWDQAKRIFRTDASGTPVEVQDLDAAGSAGVISVPASTTTLLLEKGVTVTFDSTGDKGFKPGDYWVFAARTTDASIELLDRALPRGVHHHFARLGIWDVGAGTVTDCRHPWPPEAGEGHDCSCTSCVTEQSHASGSLTIQEAVNQASQTGGTVCVGPGQYALREPVMLNGLRSVRIRGQGPATMVVAPGAAFIVRNCAGAEIENLAVLSLGQQPAISVQTAIGLGLRRLLIAVPSINDNSLGSAISLGGLVLAASIAENAVFGSVGFLANDPAAPREGEQEPYLLASALAIDDNVLWCRRRAVALDGQVLHLLNTRITGNDVIACTQVGVSTLGVGLAGSSMTISRNSLSVAGNGIRCSADGAWITDNKLINTESGDVSSIGIALASGLGKDGTEQAQILANQIRGFGLAGIGITAPVRDLIIKLNIIENCGNGILSTDDANAGSLSIENNHLRNIDAVRPSATTMVIGIGVMRAQSATIAGNAIRDLGVQTEQSSLRAGVLAFGVDRPRIAGNEIIQLAPTGDFLGRSGGIVLAVPMTDFEVTHNRVERDVVTSATQPTRGQWSALLVLNGNLSAAVTRVAAVAAVRVDDTRMLVLGAGRPFVAGLAAAAAGLPPGATGSILGNVCGARGDVPAVEVAAGQLLFSDNRVDARRNNKVAVQLRALVMIVSTNRVIGGEASIDMADVKIATVIGNITTGAISPSPSPQFANLNLRG
jgi:hypothetical protein